METIVRTEPDGAEHRAIGSRNHVVTNRRAPIDEDVERAATRGVYLDNAGTRRIVGAGGVVPDGWERIEDADVSKRKTNSIEERAGARAAEREQREDKADRGSREDRATRRGDRKPRTDEDRAREAGQTSPTSPATPPPSDGPTDYSKLKQPDLKAELDRRGIPYKKGAVKNADLVKLLKADDKAKAKA